jgi:hypothetical protein
MKQLLGFAGLLAAAAAPSFAQETTTLQTILAKGVVIHDNIGGTPVDIRVTYKADGTSVMNIMGPGGKGAEVAGAWRADGDKVCTSNAMNPVENCFDLPPGKKPGDSFKVMTARGEATLTINP